MPSTDTFKAYRETASGPYRNAVAVTPSDSDDLPAVTRALYVGTSGDVAVIMAGAASSTETAAFKGVQIGTKLDLRVSRVLLTGSSLTTGIVALW